MQASDESAHRGARDGDHLEPAFDEGVDHADVGVATGATGAQHQGHPSTRRVHAAIIAAW